ncbi:Xaa-Pro dipeptidase [Pasteurellaceae bacterium RH1A]|nr:Xaa-Pro dipeptidase [Pasteurellaceae bacterium RH1A]
MQGLFTQHITRLQAVFQQALEQARLDGIWIYAGQAHPRFLDDSFYPFKINPHFNWVLPCPEAEKSWIFVDGKNKPQVYFYAPQDYWHVSPRLPKEAFFAGEFDWHVLGQAGDIAQYIQNPQYCAFLGEDEALAQGLGFGQINPQKVLNILHFERSIKSEFEIACIGQAQISALRGHEAAKEAFFAGLSEFEINLAYLKATQQSDTNVPYGNIVAINEHAAVLHYTALDHSQPTQRHSFLLDAGTTFLGYASDLTRTYAFDEKSEFAEILAKLEGFKAACISNLQVGINYLHYHTQMHQWISELLAEHKIINLSAADIFEEGYSRLFFPHGLGHSLGLQVHDVAGFQQNPRGTRKAPPEVYPSLRCTRDLAENMVLTIEPGFYFIDMLLEPHRHNHHFNWSKIEALRPYGGIRTEDNIVMRANGAENLTLKATV